METEVEVVIDKHFTDELDLSRSVFIKEGLLNQPLLKDNCPHALKVYHSIRTKLYHL
ncbi:MAG: hypothetical protein KAG61_01130 [Bacteriovoracaceae bacterium]|nr:hypothetical protein [Bacteriovoracaceae bacterium]